MNKKDLAIALGIGGLVGVGIILAKKIQSQSTQTTQSTPQVEIKNVYVK